MNITVFLGSSDCTDPSIVQAARELGAWIGESGNALVYGGSRVGLMGVLAEAALQTGAEVTGVEPRFFVDECLQYDAITRLIVTEDMAERKDRLIGLGDAFVAFPGGQGTFEELGEVMSRIALGRLRAPCVIYDLDGYYQGLRELFAKMEEKGLSSPERMRGVSFARDLEEVEAALAAGLPS